MSQPAGLRVGIVGCGFIGAKRAEVLEGPDELVACFDVDPPAAERLAARHGAKACTSLDELLALHLDVVIVAVVHDALAEAACAALRRGCHVLVEKPAGIGTEQVDRIAAEAAYAERLVKVGFNHRFHQGIARAVEEASSGRFGPVMFLRAHYGHGGRLGYEREWRADPVRSGGGELVDQGMHLLDLSWWLLGDLPVHSAMLRSQFWKAPVEDNAVVVLGAHGPAAVGEPWAMFHVSWTEWKNQFSFEITCERAKWEVAGLSGSYGPQRLTVYRMRPEMGPPDAETVTYPEPDGSWRREWAHFRRAVAGGRPGPLLGDLASARYAWRCVEAITGR
jgi:predicted dehydrogenase